MDNTFRLIRANGFDHVSLQMIAENSGISKSLLQSYYPHKARLMTDIVRNLFNTMWDQVEINYHAPKKNPLRPGGRFNLHDRDFGNDGQGPGPGNYGGLY